MSKKKTLEERVKHYQTLRAPGQPNITPFGISGLIYDLWEEVQRLRREQEQTRKEMLDMESNNMTALLEEVITNGDAGSVSLYMWFLSERDLIVQELNNQDEDKTEGVEWKYAEHAEALKFEIPERAYMSTSFLAAYVEAYIRFYLDATGLAINDLMLVEFREGNVTKYWLQEKGEKEPLSFSHTTERKHTWENQK